MGFAQCFRVVLYGRPLLILRITTCIALLLLTACAPGRTLSPVIPQRSAQTRPPTARALRASAVGKITHIVVIIQENRSFDNLFQGFPNADTQSFGTIEATSGPPQVVALQKIPLAGTCDINHSHLSWAADWDGGSMDGFNKATRSCPQPNRSPMPKNYAYSYVDPADLGPYRFMASNYTLMDEVFEDPTAPSFVSHLHLIAGQSASTSENPSLNGHQVNPWGCDSPTGTTVPLFNGLGDKTPGVFPCFTSYATIADLLSAKSLSWRYYAPTLGNSGSIWSAFDAVASVRIGPQWSNVISPQTRILTEANAIPSVTYVVPSYRDSDHAGSNSNSGPAWVAQVVNAIGTSPNWKTTAIFVLWDDWGGWYDHVAPAVSADDTIGGFRVPVLCISPYSEQHNIVSPVVDHTQHGTDGILSFIEETFALGSLNAQDKNESPFDDCFNFKQTPSRFRAVPIPPQFNKSYFLNEPNFGTSPDDDN
jgi:phospholipase C